MHYTAHAAAVLAACLAATATAAATAPADELAVDLAGFGLKLHGPAGWSRVEETTYSQLARFVKLDGDKPVGLIEITAVPAQGRPADAEAAVLAAHGHGKVDGPERAGPPGTLRVTPAGDADYPSRRTAVIPTRNGFVLVEAGAAKADALDTAWPALLAGMKFAPSKPAADDLSLGGKFPVGLFDSAVLLPLPEAFRPDKAKDPKQQMFFGAHDWPSGHDEASIQVQLLPNPKHAPMERIAEASSKGLSAKFGTTITAAKSNDAPEAYLSTPFSTGPGNVQRVGHVRLDDDHIAIIVFRSTAAQQATRDRYMDAAEKMLAAARVSNAYQEGRQQHADPTADH